MKLIQEILEEVGAIITNSHIVYTSGKHGSVYVNKDAIYPYTQYVNQICQDLARRFVHDFVDVVIAPAVGAVVLAQRVANYLSEFENRQVLAVFADKEEDGSFMIRRGYELIVPGKKCLVLDDILNTGGSAKKVVDVTREIGGMVIGVGAICNRGGVTAIRLGVSKLEALLNIPLEAWDEGKCPLCSSGVSINTGVGKGRAYLLKKMLLQ